MYNLFIYNTYMEQNEVVYTFLTLVSVNLQDNEKNTRAMWFDVFVSFLITLFLNCVFFQSLQDMFSADVSTQLEEAESWWETSFSLACTLAFLVDRGSLVFTNCWNGGENLNSFLKLLKEQKFSVWLFLIDH